MVFLTCTEYSHGTAYSHGNCGKFIQGVSDRFVTRHHLQMRVLTSESYTISKKCSPCANRFAVATIQWREVMIRHPINLIT